MLDDDDASAVLLAHAEVLYSLHSAADILAYLSREARDLTHSTVALASYLSSSEPWQRGLHVAADLSPTAPMISAAFAVQRRLSARPEPLQIPSSEETKAIFRGFGLADADGASLLAIPLLNRRRRLVGQLVLVVVDGAGFGAAGVRATRHFTRLASVSLENANRLAFARRDQDRLQLLSEATDEALWDWNLESNAFWWGGGIDRVIKSGGEIVGTTAPWKLERMHPADVARVRAALDRAIASTDSSWSCEYRFRRADGTWALVEDRGYFLRDVNGRAYRMIGAVRDVSTRKWAETQQEFLVNASAALAESLDVETHLATVASLAARSVADWCAIVLFGADGENATLSLGAYDATALPPVRAALEALVAAGLPDEVKRTRLVTALSSEPRAALGRQAPHLAAALDAIGARSIVHVPILTGERLLGLITLVTSTHSMRAYRDADVAFAEEFARRCAVAIEKARLYEQAQNAIRARDAFMAILGHELRNPLSPITTALHLMKLRDRKSVREQQVIERQVKHLTRLIDDLLDVSRIERGKIELSKRPIQLSEIVAKAVEVASPLLEGRNHRLELDIAPTGLLLLADETRAVQVVANILTNAARYTDPSGHIVVTARREGQQAVLRVRDNGIGMKADLLPRVFDLFVQGPRTPDRRQGGLGLGLSLVRSLVTLHGGSVEAHSDGLGTGSEFIVRLPALPIELVEGDAERVVAACPVSADGRRILLVDDNVDAAELLAELLSRLGHEVTVAHDGPQALSATARFDPDVAILDIGLPVMDGYELAGRLLRTVARRPFLIALTGYGQEHDRARARDAGFDEHIVKPVDPERLLEAIDRAGGRAATATKVER